MLYPWQHLFVQPPLSQLTFRVARLVRRCEGASRKKSLTKEAFRTTPKRD